MGRIAKVLSFVRAIRGTANVSDVKIDPGGGANVTPEHFSAPGDDSFPLTTDYVVTEDVPRTGGEAAVGYVDPINTPKAREGDKRIYARDPVTGATVIDLWLKSDGSGTLENSNGVSTLAADGSQTGSNASGSFALQANGDFVVNGVTIAADGKVTIPASLTLNGKEIAEHDHSQDADSAGDTQVDTGPNN